jgi:hypothetical protein
VRANDFQHLYVVVLLLFSCWLVRHPPGQLNNVIDYSWAGEAFLALSSKLIDVENQILLKLDWIKNKKVPINAQKLT